MDNWNWSGSGGIIIAFVVLVAIIIILLVLLIFVWNSSGSGDDDNMGAEIRVADENKKDKTATVREKYLDFPSNGGSHKITNPMTLVPENRERGERKLPIIENKKSGPVVPPEASLVDSTPVVPVVEVPVVEVPVVEVPVVEVPVVEVPAKVSPIIPLSVTSSIEASIIDVSYIRASSIDTTNPIPPDVVTVVPEINHLVSPLLDFPEDKIFNEDFSCSREPDNGNYNGDGVETVAPTNHDAYPIPVTSEVVAITNVPPPVVFETYSKIVKTKIAQVGDETPTISILSSMREIIPTSPDDSIYSKMRTPHTFMEDISGTTMDYSIGDPRSFNSDFSNTTDRSGLSDRSGVE